MTCDDKLIVDLKAFTVRMKMDQAGRILQGIAGSDRARARRDYERKLAHLSYSTKTSESPNILKMAADGSEFRGYGSTFNNTDLQGDVVAPGAFAKSIRRNGGRVPLLWMHSLQTPIGSAKELREDTHGLVFTGELRMEVQQAREAAALLKHRDIDAFSIGFLVAKDGARMRNGVRELHELELMEISVVSFAANPQARLA